MSAKSKKSTSPSTVTKRAVRDPRLPKPGSVVERKYHGRTLRLKVGESDFVLDGKAYPSISSAAKSVVKCEVNGFLFWGLTR